MGIRFETEEDALGFEMVIKRLNSSKDELFGKKNKKEDSSKLNDEKINSYCELLKEKFGSGDKYDEKYSEDGTTIYKHNNLKSLLNVSCNIETKQFTFGKISEELKEIFLTLGIKKKDLERDSEFAYTIVKKVLVCLGNKTELKNSVVDQIEHKFPPPEEREKLRKQEEAAEAKMNSIKNKRKQTKKKPPPKPAPKPQTKPVQTKPVSKPAPQKAKPAPAKPKPQPAKNKPQTTSQKTPSSKPEIKVSKGKTAPPPPPPPPPPPVPTAPVAPTAPTPPKPVPIVVSNPKNEKQEEDEENSGPTNMEKELAKVKLKKVVKEPQAAGFDRMIQGSDRNFLQNALSNAIRIRRNNLHMHDDDDEDDDDEDDW